MKLSHPRKQNARHDDVGEGDGEDVFPAEAHELVVAEAGEGPAHPDEEDDEEAHLDEEDEGIDDETPPFGLPRHIRVPRQAPAAEKKGHHEARGDDHGCVFAEEKEGEFHRRIFGVVPADEFGFAFGQVERKPVGFGEGRDEEDQERDEHRYPEDVAAESLVMPGGEKGKDGPAVVDLILHHVGKAQVAHDEKDGDDREAHGNFVGDHLRAGADAAEERVLRV